MANKGQVRDDVHHVGLGVHLIGHQAMGSTMVASMKVAWHVEDQYQNQRRVVVNRLLVRERQVIMAV